MKIDKLKNEFDARYPELYRSEGGYAYTTCEEEVWDFIKRNFIPKTEGIRVGDEIPCRLCGKTFVIQPHKASARYCNNCRYNLYGREKALKTKQKETEE